jgi:hypothetical protein
MGKLVVASRLCRTCRPRMYRVSEGWGKCNPGDALDGRGHRASEEEHRALAGTRAVDRSRNGWHNGRPRPAGPGGSDTGGAERVLDCGSGHR